MTQKREQLKPVFLGYGNTDSFGERWVKARWPMNQNLPRFMRSDWLLLGDAFIGHLQNWGDSLSQINVP